MKLSIAKYKTIIIVSLLLSSTLSYSQVQIDSTNRKVLVVIDNEMRGTLGAMKDLEAIAPAEKIERINILKDSAAITKYGWLAKEGVIEIFLKNDNIFQPVEIEAKFPGGSMAWKLFLEKYLVPSVVTDNGGNPGEYKVEVQFTVSAEGKLSDFKPISKNGFGMEEELIRVLKKSPDWIPAMQNGRIVTAFKKQTVAFVVTKSIQRIKAK